MCKVPDSGLRASSFELEADRRGQYGVSDGGSMKDQN